MSAAWHVELNVATACPAGASLLLVKHELHELRSPELVLLRPEQTHAARSSCCDALPDVRYGYCCAQSVTVSIKEPHEEPQAEGMAEMSGTPEVAD